LFYAVQASPLNPPKCGFFIGFLYQSLMNAGVRIPSLIESLTGISNTMIRSAALAAIVMREVSD